MIALPRPRPVIDQRALLSSAIAASLPGEIREQLIARRDRLDYDRPIRSSAAQASRSLLTTGGTLR